MRYHFFKFFLEPTPAPAGGDPKPAPAPQPAPTPAPAPAPKADDPALLAKIAELEKKITEMSTPKPAPKPEPAPKAEDDKIPAWAKTLVEQNEKLATQLTTLQAEKTNSTRKALFEAELKTIEGLPDYYRNEVLDGFEGRSFATDADFDTFKKNKIEAAKKVASEVSASQMSVFSAPKTNTGGGNANKTSSAMAEYLKSKQPQSKN
ncbi:MAG: hypothetical protein ACTHLB_05515 [Parafilimonas sp.]